MGNAAIQAAERARDLLAEAVSREARGSDAIAWCSPTGACSTPSTRSTASASPRRSCLAEVDVRHHRHRPARTRRRGRPAQFKGGGVGPSPTYSYSAAIVEVEVDPETGMDSRAARLDRARHRPALNPTLVRGQVEGSVYMGLGEALMEEHAFRRLPPNCRTLVHKFPSMLEYKSPTTLRHAGGLHRPGRGPRIRDGPFGAKEVGPGTAAAGDAGGRQRGLRRRRRAGRRGADHAAEDPEGARGQGRRASRAAVRPQQVSPVVPWPEPIYVRTPAEGGRGRQGTTTRAGDRGRQPEVRDSRCSASRRCRS